MLIRFIPEADAELTEARRWYSHKRQDLDLEFMQCIDDALAQVVRNPHFFPAVYRNLQFSIRAAILKYGSLELGSSTRTT